MKLIKKSEILSELLRLIGVSEHRALRQLTITVRGDSPSIELEIMEFATKSEQESVQ